jgi:hypothetical protein
MLAAKGWQKMSVLKQSAHGLKKSKCYGMDDWYEVSDTGQLGYLKFVCPVRAFSEDLAARLASCVDLPCPQVEVSSYRKNVLSFGQSPNVGYACFSPVLGEKPRVLDSFIKEELFDRVPKCLTASVKQVSQDISALMSFWVWTAHTDRHSENVVVSLSNRAQDCFSAYGIDNEDIQFGMEDVASIELGNLFQRFMPFHIDTGAMMEKAEAIQSVSKDKIHQIIRQSFDRCQICLSGIAEHGSNPGIPSARIIEEVLLKRQATLKTDLASPAYMSRVFCMSHMDDYLSLKKRSTPSRAARRRANPANISLVL